MAATNLKSKVSIARYATIILGIATMGIGLYSHFQSDWVKLEVADIRGRGMGKLHKVTCGNIIIEKRDINCPPISYERYYVSMVIIAYVLSLLGFFASFIINLAKPPFKHIDLGYHVIAAILLLIAAIMYIISAVQIDDLDLRIKTVVKLKLRGGEKFVAGALTILLSVVYAATAFLIKTQQEETPRKGDGATESLRGG